MKTIQPEDVPVQQKDQLREIANNSSGSLRELLMHLSSTSDAASNLTFAVKDEVLTPNQAAELLGMSRSHLTKILDRGTIPYDPVGTHRKIRLSDLTAFAQRRDAERRELAERFAAQGQTRAASIDEIASTL